jgi:hypothetical protein
VFIWSAGQQKLQTGDPSTSDGINKLFPIGIPAFVKNIENTNSLSAASSIDKYFPQFRKGLDELFPACPMLDKNDICQKMRIQIKKLMEESTKNAKRALLILKVILKEKVAHRSSVVMKDLVNEISK